MRSNFIKVLLRIACALLLLAPCFLVGTDVLAQSGSVKITSPANGTTLTSSNLKVTVDYTKVGTDDYIVGIEAFSISLQKRCYTDFRTVNSKDSGTLSFDVTLFNTPGQYRINARIAATVVPPRTDPVWPNRREVVPSLSENEIVVNFVESPEVSTTGLINIDSIPSGARLYLDGQYNGETNQIIPKVSPGIHTIVLSKAGYQDFTSTVTVIAGQTTDVKGTLIASSAPLTAPKLSGMKFSNINPPVKYLEIKEGDTATFDWVFTGNATASLTAETKDGITQLGKVEMTGKQAVTPLVTTKYTVTATNTAGGVAAFVVVRIVPKTPPTEAQVQQNLKDIMDMYYKLDLNGSPDMAGWQVNATWSAQGFSGSKVVAKVEGTDISVPLVKGTNGGIICGDYQGAILRWLTVLRWSPKYSQLLNGLEYGPIKVAQGAHNYAVIYFSGYNWADRGLRLDPWVEQKTAAYTFVWDVSKLYSSPDNSTTYNKSFPINGGAGYPTPETPTTTALPLKNIQHVDVKCPVNVLVTNRAGKQIGVLANGTPVNQIPEAGFLTYPEADNTFEWYFALPLQDTYTLQITGTDNGDFHLMRGTDNDPLQDYANQPIGKGQQATITLDPTSSSNVLTLPDGKKITPAGTNPAPGPTATPEPKPTPPDFDYTLVILGIIAVVILLVAITVSRKRGARNKTAQTVTVPQSAKTPARPVSPTPPVETTSTPVGGVSCSKCGAVNPVGVAFCIKCGQALTAAQAVKFCPKCGDSVKPGEKFCDKCGAKLV